MNTVELIPTKVKRYAVNFKGQIHFINTVSKESALVIVRARLLSEKPPEGKERDEDLGTFDRFKANSTVKESLRW